MAKPKSQHIQVRSPLPHSILFPSLQRPRLALMVYLSSFLFKALSWHIQLIRMASTRISSQNQAKRDGERNTARLLTFTRTTTETSTSSMERLRTLCTFLLCLRMEETPEADIQARTPWTATLPVTSRTFTLVVVIPGLWTETAWTERMWTWTWTRTRTRIWVRMWWLRRLMISRIRRRDCFWKSIVTLDSIR